MADIIDDANDRADSEREYRISEARRKAPAAEYHASCKWCGDPTEGGAGYCTKDCRDDHQEYLKAAERSGK